MLADGVLGVDFGNIAVVLLDGFFQFCLFGVFVLAGFGGLAVELFGCELCARSVLVGCVVVGVERWWRESVPSG